MARVPASGETPGWAHPAPISENATRLVKISGLGLKKGQKMTKNTNNFFQRQSQGKCPETFFEPLGSLYQPQVADSPNDPWCRRYEPNMAPGPPFSARKMGPETMKWAHSSAQRKNHGKRPGTFFEALGRLYQPQLTVSSNDPWYRRYDQNLVRKQPMWERQFWTTDHA